MGAIVPVSQQIKKISFLPYFSERRDSVLSPQRKEIQISNHFKKNRIRHLCAVQYGVALDQAFSPDPTDCPWVSEDGQNDFKYSNPILNIKAKEDMHTETLRGIHMYLY